MKSFLSPKFMTVAALAAIVLVPSQALAYSGPGAGITAFGSLLALLAALFFAIIGFVWYPVKRLMKSFKKTPAPAPDTAGK